MIIFIYFILYDYIEIILDGDKPDDGLIDDKILESTEQKMKAPDYMVAFSGLSNSYCIGIVDIKDSTKISANMNEKQWSKYYGFFLNSMASMLPRFGGVPIKNGGDNILFYFPESSKVHKKYGFISCLECCLSMIEEHELIQKKLEKENLPCLDYRVSADYGRVVLMKQENSSQVDLIGPPVNMCAKINHMADTNGVIIGGDLHQAVKDFEDYSYKPKSGFSIGLKFTYPTFTVLRKHSKKIVRKI